MVAADELRRAVAGEGLDDAARAAVLLHNVEGLLAGIRR